MDISERLRKKYYKFFKGIMTDVKPKVATEAPKAAAPAAPVVEKPKKDKKVKKEKKEKKEVKEAKPAKEKKPEEEKKAKVAKKPAEKEKRKAFMIDCTLPVKDKVFQAKELVEYFLNRIKVAGKIKNLGKNVAVTCDDGKKIKVNTEIPLAKRYLKYLAKKFLKKQEVRDYLRLVAPSKAAYEFKYFKMESGE